MPDFELETTFDYKFSTRQYSDGALVTWSSGAVEIYEDNSLTQITAAETLTIDFDGVTGLHNLRVACTAANGFEVGKCYAAVASAGTVGGTAVTGEVILNWTIEKQLEEVRSDVAAIHSQTTVIESDSIIVESSVQVVETDTGNIYSDTTAIHSQTTVVESDSIIVESSVQAIEGWGDPSSDLAAIESELIVVHSDTSAIHSQTTVIESDSIIVESSVQAVEVDTGNIYSDTTVIESDTTAVEAGVVLVAGTADSGTTTTLVDAALTEADTDYWKGAHVVFTSGTIAGQVREITAFTPGTDTVTFSPATTQAVGTNTYTIISGVASSGMTAAQDSKLTVVHSDTTAIESELIVVHSDTSAIHSQTTVIESDSIIVESSVQAVEVDTGNIYSDTTAIHSQTTVIESDSIIVESSVQAVETDTGNIYSDTTAIHSQTTVIESDTTEIEADVIRLDQATILAEGVADSGTTTTLVDAALTEADTDYWAGAHVVFHSGTIAGQVREITAFTPGTDTVTFSPATTQAVATNSYKIVTGVASSGMSGAQDSKLTQVHSDTLIIGSQTTVIESDTTAIEAAGGALTGAQDSKLTRIQSDMLIVESDIVQIYSDTTAIHSQTTVIESDSIIVESSVQAVETDTGNIYSDTTIITDTDGVVLGAAGVDLIWDEIINTSAHNTAQSAGQRLRQIDQAFVVTEGTADGGTSTTIDLETGVASTTDDIYNGDRVIIISGTGAGEHGIIVDYDGVTNQRATMSKAWVVTPDATSEYIVVPADADVETWNNTAVTGTGDMAQVESDLTVIESDTAAIHSQTTVIESDSIIVESSVQAVEAWGDPSSDLAAIESELILVHSETTVIQSDTTAIHSQTTVIESDSIIVESSVQKIESDTAVIESDTTAIHSDTTIIASDVVLIEAVTTALGSAAAANLALSAGNMVAATVDTVINTHTPTTTEFQADDVTEATTDHFKGRIVIFTSGVLQYQATDITAYAAVGGIGQFTVTAMTEAPSNNDTFIIV
jgi:hypothetical protein